MFGGIEPLEVLLGTCDQAMDVREPPMRCEATAAALICIIALIPARTHLGPLCKGV